MSRILVTYEKAVSSALHSGLGEFAAEVNASITQRQGVLTSLAAASDSQGGKLFQAVVEEESTAKPVVTLGGGTLSVAGENTVPAEAGKSDASAKPARPKPVKVGSKKVTLDVRPDTVDFRDKMFEPTLIEVPVERTLEQYRKEWKNKKPVILDQGQEGACTGFGLAAVANFLLQRRKVFPDTKRVSARMLYEMARRYDEWDGENYSGSSARGAMKGWHKHGVCGDQQWPYKSESALGTLTPDRAMDALLRPLGAYFRVNHQDLVAMHSALAEVGILYATSSVHEGWSNVGSDGIILQSDKMIGGHAFALVGYDAKGFWLQNSWDEDWGLKGFAHISYDDWLENGSDVWVARLGVPVTTGAPKAGKASGSAKMSADVRRAELQSHTVAIGNDGLLRQTGEVGNTEEDVRRIFAPGGDFDTKTKNWKKKRLLLYAHGGLVGEPGALQRVAEYLPPLLAAEVYPLAFIWKTDFFSTLGNILKDIFQKRRPEGFLDSAKDFMLDRIDDTLEPLARGPGKMLWDEMKENAVLSTSLAKGGASLVLELILELLKRDPSVEIHIAGHSAGSIFMGPFLRRFCEAGKTVESLNLWAPACTMEFFKENYAPALAGNRVGRFALFTLKDPAERDDDCANIYHKSLLYLVAHAFEKTPRVFFGDGTPLLGMEKFILQEPLLFDGDPDELRRKNPASQALAIGSKSVWVRSPNNLDPKLDQFASHSRSHGGFDDDKATVITTLAQILGDTPPVEAMPVEAKAAGKNAKKRRAVAAKLEIKSTPDRLRCLRQQLETH